MDALKILLTAPLSAVALFIITRIIGRKQLSELDLFDYVTGITIGSIAAELATDLEDPLQPFIALIIWSLISLALSLIGNKFNRSRKFINGEPIVIMKNGKLLRNNFSKCKLDLSEFLMLARQAGYFDLSEVDCAIAEYNGKISFLPVAENRPACPEDLNITVDKAKMFSEVILDGEIIEDKLKTLGFDRTWLTGKLDEMKLPGHRDIFLALCSEDGELLTYPMGSKPKEIS